MDITMVISAALLTLLPFISYRFFGSAAGVLGADRRCGMQDVFVVTSRGTGRTGHIARIVHGADEEDARQTHQAHYPDESIVDITPRYSQLRSITPTRGISHNRS